VEVAALAGFEAAFAAGYLVWFFDSPGGLHHGDGDEVSWGHLSLRNPISKSEIRNPKSETNSNPQRRKSKTEKLHHVVLNI
jgi:hypothetical protein